MTSRSPHVLPQPPCIVFVANRGYALTSSRIYLIRRFLAQGWRVVVATSRDHHAQQLELEGATLETAIFQRGGLFIYSDLQALQSLVRIYRKYRPRLIHHFHAKPIILGTLAARWINGAKVVNTITGLGHAFISGGLSQWLAEMGYRQMLSRSTMTIFQNSDDLQLFMQKGWVTSRNSGLIISSGVDTERFRPLGAGRHELPRVLMATRLLWEKGIREFVEAAQIIKRENPSVRFQLAGEWDLEHPNSVDPKWVESVAHTGTIEFLGYLTNLEEELPWIDIFVLPSYYREGMPRVLLEAAACGIPVVTTDAPGCREAVVDGETGFLVPPRDGIALARSISTLLCNPPLCQRMGIAGRQRVLEKFDIRRITEQYLNTYHSIGIKI